MFDGFLLLKKRCGRHMFDILQAHFSQATFRTLATNKYWKDSLAGKGILVTVEPSPSSLHIRI